jgi:GT2 family glycosyltransferase
MKVSVLIHNLNRASILERCLSSVAKQTYRPLEVLILDAGSTDGSPEVIRNAARVMEEAGMEVKCKSCPPMGVAASRNYGAKQASGELLCIIDNDACFIDSTSIDQAVLSFQANPRLAVISFRILASDTGEIDPFTWVYRRPLKPWSGKEFKTFTFTGGGFCTRAEAFQGAGGFWDHLEYSREEEEIGLALLNERWELLYVPGVIIRHFSDPSGRATIAQRRNIELKNGILVFWRRLPLPLAVLAISGRILTMSLKMLLREKTLPSQLLRAIPEAAKEWQQFSLQRVPVSYKAVWKYASLHFT